MTTLEKINLVREKYKVLRKRLLLSYTEGYLGKEKYEYLLNNGTKKVCEQITKNNTNGDAVVIIPVLENKNMLLIIESRPVTEDEVAIEFPAGMIDANESPFNAALRELKEETGLVPKTVELLEWHYQDQGCSKAKIYTFLAEGCEIKSKQHLDEGELIETVETTPEEVIELIDNNTIRDANSKIAMLTYKRK